VRFELITSFHAVRFSHITAETFLLLFLFSVTQVVPFFALSFPIPSLCASRLQSCLPNQNIKRKEVSQKNPGTRSQVLEHGTDGSLIITAHVQRGAEGRDVLELVPTALPLHLAIDFHELLDASRADGVSE
jgi:hypothetical protein